MTTIVLLSVILVCLFCGFYALVKQQGRILLRLDQLEQTVSRFASIPADRDSDHQPMGLSVETPFPAFVLLDLAGKEVEIQSFRGRGVLLLHWSFECGFCDLLAPEVVPLLPALEKQNIQLVLLAYGDAKSNREQAAEDGLKCPILLIRDNKTPSAFGGLGTPSAYLLDGDGRVAAPLATGAAQVLALARQAASSGISSFAANDNKTLRHRLSGERSLSESQIERNGLKAGTRAPLFHLPDLQGHLISLDKYQGRRVLLVFSDPHCGPCDALAPNLARLHRDHSGNGMAFVLVGRGNEEENRRKAEQHGIQFPVVLQEKWKLSKEYGIFATPVAFLIGEDGVLARDVAVGAEAVLALAEEGLGAGRTT